MRLTELISAYADAERVHPEHRELFRKLQRVALDTVYAENERAGEARQVVADLARVLGTDIDAGPGHRWDADHMQRVVEAARLLREERDELVAKHATTVDLLRSEYERANAAIRREEVADEHFDEKSKECEALRERLAGLETSADYWGATAPGGSLIDDLKNIIISQAREIARLKGESA
ncbi:MULTISPECIES: hypothetical protein [unclassified Streptomyces]|uniref:hypothetical protein n=1 Tax=unclassified Streptomyces TaxID=2593676 RepID=UPI00035DC7B9|nr:MULTISPECIES: hypothetical protein [unclassified Streptomyces]MYY03075.1 hypothetical protein [Streptomyces sp. SID4913]